MDRVLPDVPVRQWVVTAPYEVGRVLALRPDALTAQNRIFVEEIARWQKQKAKALGVAGGSSYPAQISVDPIGPDTWKLLQGMNAVRRLTGYESGALYWLRFATARGDPQSAWSDPVAVIAR